MKDFLNIESHKVTLLPCDFRFSGGVFISVVNFLLNNLLS